MMTLRHRTRSSDPGSTSGKVVDARFWMSKRTKRLRMGSTRTRSPRSSKYRWRRAAARVETRRWVHCPSFAASTAAGLPSVAHADTLAKVLEVPLAPRGREGGDPAVGVLPLLRGLDGGGVHVGGPDVHFVGKRAQLVQQHGDAVGLLPGGAPGRPDAELAPL